MARRKWNQPIVEQEGTIVQMPDGSVRQGVTVGLCEEDHEMIRDGYKCAWCLQVFDAAWPEKCHICEMTPDAWMEWYRETNVGAKHYGPSESWDDRRERLRQELAYRNKLAKNGVWLPDMVTPDQINQLAVEHHARKG